MCMRKYRKLSVGAGILAAILLLASLAIQASSELGEAPAAAAEGAAAQGHAAAQPALSEAKPLPLPARLTEELGKLQEPPDRMTEWLEAAAARYDSSREPARIVQADLDGDGLRNEWLAVLRENRIDEQDGETAERRAYGIAISYRDGKYALDHFAFPEESFGKAELVAVEDLTGDGKPEAVWVSHVSGAHTTVSTYTVTAWPYGALRLLKGEASIPNVSGAAVSGGKLALTGGLIGSAGAGPWQREYTDMYAVADGAVKRVDRTFADSPTPYHRMIDGLWAEAHGHADKALQLYGEAAEMATHSYRDYMFIFGDEWIEGSDLSAEQEQAFDHVVKQFAQLRKERLNAQLQGQTPEAACAAAREAAGYEQAWLAYLNAPAGYVNPVWSEAAICAQINELEQ